MCEKCKSHPPQMPVLLACFLMLVACAILLGLVVLLVYAACLSPAKATLDYGQTCAMLQLA